MAAGKLNQGRSGGSILILTVWTLLFLASLAVAVASYVSGGLNLARQAANGAYGHAAVQAGVEDMIAVLSADTNEWDGFREAWGKKGERQWDRCSMGDAAYSIYFTDSAGATNAGVVDEESRLNVNTADRQMLEVLFAAAGDMDSVSASSLASAVIDWRDEDEDITAGGAESEYYAGLSPGYRCSNRQFGHIYELLLLKGMTRDVFDRVKDLVTIYGTGKININTADREVLRILALYAGGDAASAERLSAGIAVFRDSGGVFSEANAMNIMEAVKGGGLLGPEEESLLIRMMGLLSLKGSCFRGICEGGRAAYSSPAARVEFVFSRDSGRILFWNELHHLY